MRIDKGVAERLLLKLASDEALKDCDASWEAKIENLSQLCGEGSRTHIAFMGTALLAKSMDVNADLYQIKPAHSDKSNKNSFSARTLCHSVLVPVSARLGINLGVSGREPLNNQPYFRMKRLDDGTPVHAGSRIAFEFLLALVGELKKVTNAADAQAALIAFIKVRRRYNQTYAAFSSQHRLAGALASKLAQSFVSEVSEGGKRAQAVAAGILSAALSSTAVSCGRINDPSRRHPGDVCVHEAGTDVVERAFEVRDKVVSLTDVFIFGQKCISMGVFRGGVLMVHPRQGHIDEREIEDWCQRSGFEFRLYYGWDAFVREAFFWGGSSINDISGSMAECIRERLVEAEVDSKSVDDWLSLVQQQSGDR